MPGRDENSPALFEELADPAFEARLQALLGEPGPADVLKAQSAQLVPYRTLVHPREGAPYWSTRYRRIHPRESPTNVIPAAAYQGNLAEVYQAWQSLLAGQPGGPSDSLLAPVVALQEILFRGHAGLLAIQDNRVVGVATVREGGDLAAAAPFDQLQGRGRRVEQTLRAGLRAYEMA